MEVRFAVEADAESLAAAIKDVENSGFMLFGPGERNISTEGAQKVIQSLSKEPNAIVVAVESGDVLGYLFLRGESAPRVQHRATVAVVGVREEARNKGVGQKLFEFIHGIARERGLHRLQISVIAHNERAIHVYEKMGYVKEGIYKDSLYIDGQYVDEMVLGKILSDE